MTKDIVNLEVLLKKASVYNDPDSKNLRELFDLVRVGALTWEQFETVMNERDECIYDMGAYVGYTGE
jgi:hypothetical protein